MSFGPNIPKPQKSLKEKNPDKLQNLKIKCRTLEERLIEWETVKGVQIAN